MEHLIPQHIFDSLPGLALLVITGVGFGGPDFGCGLAR